MQFAITLKQHQFAWDTQTEMHKKCPFNSGCRLVAMHISHIANPIYEWTCGKQCSFIFYLFAIMFGAKVYKHMQHIDNWREICKGFNVILHSHITQPNTIPLVHASIPVNTHWHLWLREMSSRANVILQLNVSAIKRTMTFLVTYYCC